MRRAAFLSLLLLTSPGPVRAQDPDPAQLAAAMKTSVTKGVRWLTSQQQADGSWTYDNKPLILRDAYPMSQGVTALCAFTLLKCGIGPDEEPIQKAFAFIHTQEPKWTYEVGCVLLALEAKTNFDPDRQAVPEPGSATRVRKKRRPNRPDPRDRALAEKCIAWLAGHQRESGLWRYAGGSDEDLSNAQYAMLGLDAAGRMGLKVPTEIYERCAARIVECQREGDEQVASFPVPGADNTFRELAKIQAKLEREIHRVEKKFRKVEEGGTDKKGNTRDDYLHTAERKAAESIGESAERSPMVARGWAYFPPNTNGEVWQTSVNGSMTCSALAALFICKSHLEGTPRYERELKPKMREALRNGAAWMAQNFAVDRNPNGRLHHFYYLYGLERAGVLGLVHRLGTHEWFDAGVGYLLNAQRRDGSWRAGQGTAGQVPDSCFALLFLARGTTPVVQLPGRVMTGGGRQYGD